MAASRPLVMFNRVSADGYYSAPDGDLNWAVQDADLDKDAANRLDGAGTMIFGRRTYDMFESFWPHALDDPRTAPDPHRPWERSEAMRAMATWINDSRKIVFSRTRTSVTWKNSELIPELDPEFVRALKQESGEAIMIFGSGSIVSQLTAHGLIDEYQFVVSPILLGSGGRALRDVVAKLPLELLEARTYPSGNVKLRYGRK